MDAFSGLDIVLCPPEEDTHELFSVRLRDCLVALVVWRPMGVH